MAKGKVKISANMNKVKDVIDIKTGQKLDDIKGKVIQEPEREENYQPEERAETKAPSSLSDKIEQKINQKIDEVIDTKITEILSRL